MHNLRKKLIYQSDHRGTKELDLILGPFVRAVVDQLNEEELGSLDTFLSEPEPLLYEWLISKTPPKHYAEFVHDILKFHDEKYAKES